MDAGCDKTDKTSIMVLKVDLQCPCCYKKAKKLLCKTPQVRDQVYDEKGNSITIVVVCCSPERIRDKLCYKGGKAIKSIEIKEPAKPKEPEKPKGPEKTKQTEKPKGPEKPKQPEKPKDPEKPKVVTFEMPKVAEKAKEPEKPTVVDKPKPKEAEKPKEAAMVATPWAAEAVVMMPVQGLSTGCGCGQCYYTGGPCNYQYYGTPVQPAPYYGNYSYGYGPGSVYGKGPCVSGDYFNEENAQACTIM